MAADAPLLAYLFWHRPRPEVDAGLYEEHLAALHARLDVVSATFRLDALPFGDRASGYEDWYLAGSWDDLGALNAAAVSSPRREPHDEVAGLMGRGWGGLYALVRGEAHAPLAATWAYKPPGEDADAFQDSLAAEVVWRRQLVLGPAPEFCFGAAEPDSGRELVAGATGR
jgi:hypothetical protein